MSKTPSNPMHNGGWRGFEDVPAPPLRPRSLRVRVEGLGKREPAPKRDQVLTKMATTTEALTAEERKIVRGYRLSRGGAEAEAVRREIAQEIAKERDR